MRRKIPNTWALLAFDACARHESFTKAAVELSLTQSAVCRQIAGLEEFLGLQLFHRSKRGVTLTDAGRIYSRQIAQRLNALERDTLELMAHRGQGGSLELAVLPTFATRWLMPRLPVFQRANPDITLNLSISTRPFLFNETEFDAAIHCGPAAWPGVQASTLMQETLVPVCSPALIHPHQSLSVQQLQEYPLLQQSTRPYVWRAWFESLGLKVEGDLAGPRYELFSMLGQAAMAQMGICLIPPFLIEEELRTGQLIIPLVHPYTSGNSYRLLVPEEKIPSAALITFSAWLLTEARVFGDVQAARPLARLSAA